MARLAERALSREAHDRAEASCGGPSPYAGCAGDEWDAPDDEFEEIARDDTAFSPPLQLLLSGLQTACRLIRAGAPARMVVQLRLPRDLSVAWDWEELAEAAGCRWVEAALETQRIGEARGQTHGIREEETKNAEDAEAGMAPSLLPLVNLPASRAEALLAWQHWQAQSEPWIGVWCSEEAEPLAGLPAGQVQQLDLTTPACRPWLVRQLWRVQCQRLGVCMDCLPDALLAEVCALPLAAIPFALSVLLAQDPLELVEIASLHELEVLGWLVAEAVLPREASARQRWVMQEMADFLAGRPQTWVQALDAQRHGVIHEPSGCRFQVSTHARMPGLFLESRGEHAFSADLLGSLVALVNDWNTRSDLSAFIEREENGLLALGLRARLGWAAESSPGWARAELERLLQQIQAFWLVEVGMLERRSCRH